MRIYYFDRRGSYGRGIIARLSLLDPARGNLGLPQFSATSAGYLFYGSDSRFSLLAVRQGFPVLLFLLRFRFCFWQPFVWRLRTSVPLRFCVLVLPDWAGMNISLFFGMRVWDFTPLCWPFLHTVSDSFYFWIFGVFEPKGQMAFNFGIFPKFGVFTSFCVPYFLKFSQNNVSSGLG